MAGERARLGVQLWHADGGLCHDLPVRAKHAYSWRDVWVGAAVTAALFAVGKWAIGLYLGRSSVTAGFGPFASFVIVMGWGYYSAQIFLLGAEFTWGYAHHFCSRTNTPTDVEEIPIVAAAN